MGWGSWFSHLTVFQSSACQSIPSKRYNQLLAARISLCFTATASAETRHLYTWRGDIDTEYCLCYSHQPFNRKKWGGADDDGWWGWGAAGDRQHEGQEIGFADAWGKFWVCSYESSRNVFFILNSICNHYVPTVIHKLLLYMSTTVGSPNKHPGPSENLMFCGGGALECLAKIA